MEGRDVAQACDSQSVQVQGWHSSIVAQHAYVGGVGWHAVHIQHQRLPQQPHTWPGLRL